MLVKKYMLTLKMRTVKASAEEVKNLYFVVRTSHMKNYIISVIFRQCLDTVGASYV